MTIQAGQLARADDFINASEKDATPANDNGRVAKLESVAGEDAKIHGDFLPKAPTIQVLEVQTLGDGTSQYDITNPSGSTFRYTYDGTGTDPNISSSTVPVGAKVRISAGSINSNNAGVFTVTGSGDDYIEITNTGTVESDKTAIIYCDYTTYSKPTDIKYIKVEVVGAGGGGQTITASDGAGTGGGGGGYGLKILGADIIASTENVFVGIGGNAQSAGTDTTFEVTSGTDVVATGGTGGTSTAGQGGTATGVDVLIAGQNGGYWVEESGSSLSGKGGDSQIGRGGATQRGNTDGESGYLYGGGGSGASVTASATDRVGGSGANGVVIITEYYV